MDGPDTALCILAGIWCLYRGWKYYVDVRYGKKEAE
jgi:hypothetical protein